MRIHPHPKTRLILLGLALASASLTRADFVPIPISPSSFNQDPVIEATAPRSINDAVTISLDGGTNKTGNVLYEVGYNLNAPATGLPAHNSLVVVANNVASPARGYTFRMAPDYHANNVLFIGHQNGGGTPVIGTSTLTLTTPAAYTSISVLNTSANGPCTVAYVVHYGDGSTQTGSFSSTDWTSGNATTATITRAFDAGGQLGMNGGTVNISANHGVMWANDIALQSPTVNVTSIDFTWWFGNVANHNPWSNGKTAIFALAGSPDGVTFSPVTVTGYNQKLIVPADASHTFGAAPVATTGVLTNDNTYCSFTMDGGLSKANWTWYEQGYYAAYPTTGLPAAGSTITSATQPAIHYTMPSSYVGNCAVCLSSNITSASINLTTPTSAGSLAFLGGGGNGGLNIRVEMNGQGGSETNWISTLDWFDRTDPWSVVTFGQVGPGGLAVRNTPDQLANPFVNPVFPFQRDPRLSGALNQNLPIVRLFDYVIPVANSGMTITNITLVVTNTGAFGNTLSIFAVSGAAGAPPLISQPIGVVTDSTTGNTNTTTGAAVANDIRYTKGYAGTNSIILAVTNRLGDANVSYQWMKAPRGGGLNNRFYTFDLSTFAKVNNGGYISGANAGSLIISNPSVADSADYLVVATNSYGSFTSFVATVIVLTTNSSVLVGAGYGDIIAKASADTTTTIETVDKVIDQAAQKWLSWGLHTQGFDGVTLGDNVSQFTGPVGFTVTPVSGASVVSSLQFFTANDTVGGEMADYTLEGSNDGASWTRIAGGQLKGTLGLPAARSGVTGTTPINPLTQPMTEVDFPNATAWKQYRFWITNVMDFVNARMQLDEIRLMGTVVANPPVFVREPVPTVTVFAGTSPTWSVAAGGYPVPKFYWYTNGVKVPGAVGTLFTLTNVQLAQSGWQISCVASNISGTVPSTASTLQVITDPTSSYPVALLADHPMAYWRLNEGPDDTVGNDGIIAHDYAGGFNGSYSNTVLAVTGYNPVSDPDTAATFGTFTTMDSYVDAIYGLDFARGTNTGGATFSIEAWVYGGPQSVTSAVLAKGYNGALLAGTGTGTEQFSLDTGGNAALTSATRKFRFLVRDFFGNGYAAQSAVLPQDPVTQQPTWHHLVGVCDQPNGNVYLYADGLLAASATIPVNAGIQTQPLPLTIGARPSSPAAADFDNQWNGTIDDVSIYPTALSPSQVLAHYYAAQQPPLFLLSPTNLTTPENVTATVYSSAYGAGTLSYQWYLSDGTSPTTPVAGQISSNLVFTTSASQNQNYYQCVVTSQYGGATSGVAQLTVVSGPPSFIIDLPASQTIYQGHVLQLHVEAGGTAPFTYQWQRNNAPLADNYRISGSQSDTLTIAYAGFADTANYNVLVTNGQGTQPSTVDAVTVTNLTPFFHATMGDASAWQLNGTTAPVFDANGIQLSAGVGNTARSAFMTTKQNIASFMVSYIYQDVSGTGGADGATFCIQNTGPTALGGGGGSLGYSGITPSVALAFNIYASNTRGIALFTNGTVATPFVAILPVDVGNNTDKIQVNLSYNGTVLTAAYKDLTTAATYTTNLTVNIPGILGSSTAYVGFTGADGGTASTQEFSWPIALTPTQIPLHTQRVGNNQVLSWPVSAGAYLLSSPSLSPSAWALDTVDQFQIVGNQAQVIVTPGGGARFFRLQLFP